MFVPEHAPATLAAPIAAPVAVLPTTGDSILVATDGRDGATTAVLAAERAAIRLGASVQAVAVLEPLPFYGELPAFAASELDAERARTVHQAVWRQIERETGTNWPIEVAVGAVGDTIARMAARRGTGLVVIGIARHQMSDHMLGSETALEVLRGGDRPVLAVGPDADGFFRRAVVAVDFGPASTRAAAIACRLLAPGGTLSLVHVKAQLEVSEETRDAWEAHTVPRVNALLQRLAADLSHGSTGCDECGAAAGRRDVTIGTATLFGDPSEELLAYAERVGADLVAVGTHGAEHTQRAVVGNVATNVVRNASARLDGCSVLACGTPDARAAERMTLRLVGPIARH